MSESEGTTIEKEPSSVAALTPSLTTQKLSLEEEATKEISPNPPLPKELRSPQDLPPPRSVSADRVAEIASSKPTKEMTPHVSDVAIEVEIDFVLDSKKISLTALSTLREGEVMTLSGTDFRVTLFLQSRAIAEAQLVMVDQRPSIQITKIFSNS